MDAKCPVTRLNTKLKCPIQSSRILVPPKDMCWMVTMTMYSIKGTNSFRLRLRVVLDDLSSQKKANVSAYQYAVNRW